MSEKNVTCVTSCPGMRADSEIRMHFDTVALTPASDDVRETAASRGGVIERAARREVRRNRASQIGVQSSGRGTSGEVMKNPREDLRPHARLRGEVPAAAGTGQAVLPGHDFPCCWARARLSR